MRYRGPTSADGHRADAGEERGLSNVTFIGSYPAADFLIHPPLPEVAFLGRSNVGKSALLNKLVGRRSLAHTSKTPGKTRACNVYAVSDRFYLVDLPGYGYARASRAERRGFSKLIRDYLSGRKLLTGVVWLLDLRRDPSRDDLEISNLLVSRSIPVLVAATKADKIGRAHRRDRLKAILDAIGVREEQCVVTSARTREGIDELRDSVAALLDRR